MKPHSALLPALLACAACSAAPGDTVGMWLTTADGSQLLAQQPLLRFDAPASPAPYALEVDSSRTYQSIVGFGAAFTDAATYLIQEKLPAGRRDSLLRDLFGREGDGLGLSFMRMTMGSSDLSRTHWSYDDMPPGETDPTLERFSIERDREAMLPVIRQARAINPGLVLVASPWSPPGWMKTTDSMIQGSLRPEAYGSYAEYFARFLEAYDSAGVPVQYLTVQNEPQYEPGDYPGMKMPAADRARFVGQYLGPLLERRGLETGILDWDHNWDLPQEPLGVLADPVARRYVDGVAWHCYGGDVSAQGTVHDAYPQVDAFMTECSGGTWQEGGFAGALKDMMGTLVIDDVRNWARGVAFWSLALDPQNGPHLGGCGTCRGVVTIDPATGTVARNVEYYVLGHASRFVPPGSVRIASNSDVGGLKSVAFRVPEGAVVLLVLNTAAEKRTFDVRFEGRTFQSSLPAGAVATYRW